MGSCSTIVHWCSFAREVCATILEVESQPIGGVGKIVEIDESKFGKGSTIEVGELMVYGYLEELKESRFYGISGR